MSNGEVVNGLKAAANAVTGKMILTLIKDGKSVGETEIETKKASSIASVVLHTAKTAHDMTGRPLIDAEDGKATYAPIIPSGLNLGQSHMPNCTSLIFHFGESILAIAVPDAELKIFGQRLIALGATGSAH
jgi:hypothetical protein